MNQKHIHELIEPTIQALGLILWACELHHAKNQSILRVYLDRDSGVTMDDCSNASREIGAILDVEDPIKNRYQLEVSSPGLDRALSALWHFEHYVGHTIKIRLRVSQGNRKQFEATILKVENDKIFLIVDGETIKVGLGEIQKANLVEK